MCTFTTNDVHPTIVGKQLSHLVRCFLIGLLVFQPCPLPPPPVPLSYTLQEVPPYSAATSISRRLQLYPSEEALSAGGVLDLEVDTLCCRR